MNSYPYWTDVLRALGVESTLPIPLFGTFVALAVLAGVRNARGNAMSVFRPAGLAIDAGNALVDILVSAVLWGMAACLPWRPRRPRRLGRQFFVQKKNPA